MKMLIQLLGNGTQRDLNVKRNILVTFIVKGINVAINFLLVPLTIQYVKVDGYGVWLALSSIVAWLSIFDIGLGSSLRNKLVEALTKGNVRLAKVYVSTTYATITVISVFMVTVIIILNPYIDWHYVLNTSIASTEDYMYLP